MQNPLEIIADGDVELAYIVNAGWEPEQSTFLTPESFSQQMGMIVYGAGEKIIPHVHLPVMREICGTTECVIVRKGRCTINIFNSVRSFIASRELTTGTIVLLLGGGHGFDMHEDTVLFEVKQGPYMNGSDKERF